MLRLLSPLTSPDFCPTHQFACQPTHLPTSPAKPHCGFYPACQPGLLPHPPVHPPACPPARPSICQCCKAMLRLLPRSAAQASSPPTNSPTTLPTSLAKPSLPSGATWGGEAERRCCAASVSGQAEWHRSKVGLSLFFPLSPSLFLSFPPSQGTRPLPLNSQCQNIQGTRFNSLFLEN